MGRSGEEKAFRWLKRIEWRLAYIEREHVRVEKNIIRASNPRRYFIPPLIFLTGFYILSAALIFAVIGLPAIDSAGNPNFPAFMIGWLTGFVLFVGVLVWVTREEFLKKMNYLKYGMERLTQELKRREEEIYRKYPDFRGREIKVRFPYDIWRVADFLVLIFIFVSYIYGFLTGFDGFFLQQATFFLLFTHLLFEYVRERQYGVGLFGKRMNKPYNLPPNIAADNTVYYKRL